MWASKPCPAPRSTMRPLRKSLRTRRAISHASYSSLGGRHRARHTARATRANSVSPGKRSTSRWARRPRDDGENRTLPLVGDSGTLPDPSVPDARLKPSRSNRPDLPDLRDPPDLPDPSVPDARLKPSRFNRPDPPDLRDPSVPDARLRPSRSNRPDPPDLRHPRDPPDLPDLRDPSVPDARLKPSRSNRPDVQG